MSTVGRFALNNLLPALLAGTLTWAFVRAAVSLLRIRHGKLRLCLYMAPVLKSTLVLLGLLPVLPWPRVPFRVWAAEAVPTQTVMPYFALATAFILITRAALARRERQRLLVSSQPVPDASRLAASLDRVMTGYRANAARIRARCSIAQLPKRPALRVRERGLRSPAVVTGTSATVVFPASLAAHLSDADLDAALAHEVAHVHLRRPFNCFSSEGLRALSVVNPFARLMAAQLHREEEKACDDIAVDVLGNADGYATMLLRSYRHAAGAAGGVAGGLQFVHQLVGARPTLSERVENLVRGEETGAAAAERLAFTGTWLVLIAVFFAG